tara:strand:+ start:484 stop:750 length:267 start_codon:yes stop_codon:yes gene_type:complete
MPGISRANPQWDGEADRLSADQRDHHIHHSVITTDRVTSRFFLRDCRVGPVDFIANGRAFGLAWSRFGDGSTGGTMPQPISSSSVVLG